MSKIDDRSEMPFGKYKGVIIANVPDEYLLWLHGELEIKCSQFAKPLKEYLDENLDAIKMNHEAKYPKPFCND